MIVSAALLFAVNGTVSKLILQAGFQARDLATFRALGGFLGLILLGTVLSPGIRRFRLARKEIPLILVYGVTGFFAVPMLYFVAISRLPVGIALLFEFTAPVFVALWFRFGRRQPVRARLWAGLALSLVGLACVAEVWGGGMRLDGVGVAAGFTAAVLLAAYYLLGARGVTTRDSISLTGLAFGVSAVAGFATRAVAGGLPDWRVLTGEAAGGAPVWTLAVYLLICGTIIPYLLIVGSLRHLPATSVGIIGMVEPVLASAVAWITLGETEALNPAQLAGGVILLLGVGLAETARVTVGQNGPHARGERDPARDTPAPQRDSSPAAA